MRTFVVYESLWGNTAAVAAAIAEGFGHGARAVSTGEATPELLADADVVIAGAPVHVAGLPKEKTRASAAARATDAERWPDLPAPDLSHPPMRDWLAGVPKRKGGLGTGFDTRSAGGWSGSAGGRISSKLAARGYKRLAPPEGFAVTRQQGPLVDGELERARAWGAELARRAEAGR